SFLEDAFATLRGDLRLQAGVAYGEGRDGFSLLKTVGKLARPAAATLDAPTRRGARVCEHGVSIPARPAWEDAPPRFGLLPRRPSAAAVLGRRPDRFLLMFTLADGWSREELDFTLNTIRAALGSRLMEERVRGTLEQAAEIQQSLLVEEPPP